MSFHNAVNGTSILLEGTSDAELCSHLNSAASVLLGKTKVLRRQRLPLIFDLYAWVTFQGALTHMMITIPYWLRFTGLHTTHLLLLLQATHTSLQVLHVLMLFAVCKMPLFDCHQLCSHSLYEQVCLDKRIMQV